MAAKKKRRVFKRPNHVIKAPKKSKKRPAKKRVAKAKKAKKKSKRAKRKVKRTPSQAASRGWVTRRRKKAQAKRAIKQAIKRQHKELPGFSKLLDRTIEELKQREKAVEKREKDVSRIRANLERYIDTGALEAENEKVFAKLDFIETDESKMLARLRVAEYTGDFDEEAARLAEEYEWDIREVYTLFMSPKADA